MSPTTAPVEDTATRRSWRAFAVLAALVVVGGTTIEASRAAFSGTTTNAGNSITAGVVSVSDDDSGSAMFNVTGVVPGAAQTRCINVSYTGSTTSDVHLYGVVGGTGLAPYLDATIEVGTGATGGGSFSCTGFVAGSTLYTGTLAGFGTGHTDYASGLAGFDGATNPTVRSYRIVLNVQDDDAAQGLSATTTLTWEAQDA
ncbi:MAG: hypothetical protein U0Q22_14240 [Acidimicrobiales bacterium]